MQQSTSSPQPASFVLIPNSEWMHETFSICIELTSLAKFMRNLETGRHLEKAMLDFGIPLIRSASQKNPGPPVLRSLHDGQLAQLLQDALHFPQDTATDCALTK